jgi:hypothetical protein
MMANSTHLLLNKLSAVPTPGMVNVLHRDYKLKLIHDLINLTDYAENVLNKDYQSIKDKLSLLENRLSSHFVAPQIYSFFSKLCDFMDEGNISEVLKIFSALQDAPEYEYGFSNQKIQIGLIEEWERQIFHEEFVASYGADKLQPSSSTREELDVFKVHVGDTLKFIGEAEPIFLQEIGSLVSTLLLINSTSNMEGATSPRFFGAVYLSFPKHNLSEHPLLFLADSLVHEMSHLYLNTIMAYDPLVLNELNNQFSSPVRAELRPMIGVYHAVFVLSRVIRLFINSERLNLYPDRVFLKSFIKILLSQYETAYQTVSTHGILSELGKQILESTRECIVA